MREFYWMYQRFWQVAFYSISTSLKHAVREYTSGNTQQWHYFHLIGIKWAVEGLLQDEITTFGFLNSCPLDFFLDFAALIKSHQAL